jgi:hypothetical protein
MLSSAEFFRLTELLLSLGNLPLIVELKHNPGISLCFLEMFFTVEDFEMAPKLSAGTFVVVLSPADPPAEIRAEGFWLPKVAEPRIANRLVLTMASVDLVGLTILSLRTCNPLGSRALRKGVFALAQKPGRRRKVTERHLS